MVVDVVNIKVESFLQKLLLFFIPTVCKSGRRESILTLLFIRLENKSESLIGVFDKAFHSASLCPGQQPPVCEIVSGKGHSSTLPLQMALFSNVTGGYFFVAVTEVT